MERRAGETCGSAVKNLPGNAGEARQAGSTPGSGRSPGGGHGIPLRDSCLENGQRSPAGYSGVTKSWIRLSTHSGRGLTRGSLGRGGWLRPMSWLGPRVGGLSSDCWMSPSLLPSLSSGTGLSSLAYSLPRGWQEHLGLSLCTALHAASWRFLISQRSRVVALLTWWLLSARLLLTLPQSSMNIPLATLSWSTSHRPAQV